MKKCFGFQKVRIKSNEMTTDGIERMQLKVRAILDFENLNKRRMMPIIKMAGIAKTKMTPPISDAIISDTMILLSFPLHRGIAPGCGPPGAPVFCPSSPEQCCLEDFPIALYLGDHFLT